MGNGSSKSGDAKADLWRDRFAENRKAHRRAHGAASAPDRDSEDVTDTQRIQAVLADSRAPAPARGFVVVLSVFRSDWARVVALIVLVVLVLALVILGAAKLMAG